MSNMKFVEIPPKSDRERNFERTGFWFGIFPHNRGGEYPIHWHTHFELEIITRGTIEYTYNGVTTIAGPGSAYLLYCYDSHSLRMLEETEIINFRFNTRFLDKDLTEFISQPNSNLKCIFNENELKHILFLAEKADQEHRILDKFTSQMVKNILSEIIVMLIRKSNVDVDTKKPDVVQKVIAYIMNNFKSDISLSNVATEFNLSPNHLGVIFKKNIGLSFNEYLNNIRLKHACNMLINTNEPISSIAINSGYNSTEYFLYIFKKICSKYLNI